MRGERQQVDAERAHVHRNLADRLHGVGVHQRSALVGDRRDRRDRLNRSDLVVRVHHRHDGGLVGDHVPEPLGRRDAGLIHRRERHRPSTLRERFQRVEHGFVLDRARDEVAPSVRRRLDDVRRAAQCEVVRLGAAAREHDFRRIAIDQCRNG